MLLRLCFTTLLALCLTACGFHLRGNYSLPEHLKKIEVQSNDPYAPVTRAITKSLKSGGVEIVANSKEGLPTLQLGREKIDQKVLSIYQDGRTAEYRLIYKMTATLSIPGQAIRQIPLQVQRYHQDDPTGSLGKQREIEIIREEMRKQMAEQLMIKLAAE